MNPKKLSKKAIIENRRAFYITVVGKVKSYILSVDPNYRFEVKRKNLDQRMRVSSIKNPELRFAIKATKNYFTISNDGGVSPCINKGFYNMILQLEQVLLMQEKDVVGNVEIDDNDLILVDMMVL